MSEVHSQNNYKNKSRSKYNKPNNKSKSKSNSNSKSNKDIKNRSKKVKQNNGYNGRYINHEKNMNSKDNIMNSNCAEELLQHFFKCNSLSNWQLSLLKQINYKVDTMEKLNINRRTAYNDMMSYRNYHSKQKIKMKNEEIVLKVSRVLISH